MATRWLRATLLLVACTVARSGGLAPKFKKWQHNGDVLHLIDDGFMRFRMKTSKFMALFWEPGMPNGKKARAARRRAMVVATWRPWLEPSTCEVAPLTRNAFAEVAATNACR